MKKSIKTTCYKFGLLLILAMYSITVKSQAVSGAQFAMSISVASATTNTMDVNLTLNVVGPSTGMRFSAFSTSINFNTNIINGGTISAAYVQGTKSELVSSLPANSLILTTAGAIRLTTANMPTPVEAV